MALTMEKQVIPGADVIVLEEHVDYWNQYGWVDPYSSVDWTARQTDYVAKTPKGNPYTPEMVVNGEAQFVGSDEEQAQEAIEKAASGPETSVTISSAKADSKNSEDVSISVGKLEGNAPGDGADVWLAVTEDGLHSSVTAGENAGHVLYHAAVLRSLHKIGAAKDEGGGTSFAGEAKVKLKSDWKRENLHVVVFVQERKSRKIIGAASAQLAS